MKPCFLRKRFEKKEERTDVPLFTDGIQKKCQVNSENASPCPCAFLRIQSPIRDDRRGLTSDSIIQHTRTMLTNGVSATSARSVLRHGGNAVLSVLQSMTVVFASLLQHSEKNMKIFEMVWLVMSGTNRSVSS